MAEKDYVKTVYVDGSEPDVDAVHLNNTEDGLDGLYHPEFDDSGTVEGITSFPTFLSTVVKRMNPIAFYKNFKAGMKYVLHTGSLINNGLCTETGKYAADATQLNPNIANTLAWQVAKVNSDLDGFQFYATLEALGITGTNFTYQVFVDRMPVNAVLICRVSGLTFTPTNGEFYLRATCTGYPESKRIEFEAIEMSSSLSGVYKARYSAPAGTKWSGWKSTLTNADIASKSTNLTPGGGYTVLSWFGCFAVISGGSCYLQIGLSSTTPTITGSKSIICTLPTQYRPVRKYIQHTDWGDFVVDTDGTIYIGNTTSSLLHNKNITINAAFLT